MKKREMARMRQFGIYVPVLMKDLGINELKAK
jgi:hypothetical protein